MSTHSFKSEYLFLFWLVNLVHSRIFKNKLSAIVNYYGALDCVFKAFHEVNTRAFRWQFTKSLEILIEDDSFVLSFVDFDASSGAWTQCIYAKYTECDGNRSKRMQTHQGKWTWGEHKSLTERRLNLRYWTAQRDWHYSPDARLIFTFLSMLCKISSNRNFRIHHESSESGQQDEPRK